MLEFAGPVISHSALQSKILAAKQMITLLSSKSLSSGKILALTDSLQLLNSILEVQATSGWEKLKERVIFRHINRIFNTQADGLAKYGAGLNKLWFRWANL